MANLNKSGFLSKWLTLFATNGNREINAARVRDFRTDIAESFYNRNDDAYISNMVSTSGTNTYTADLDPVITSYSNYTIQFLKFTNASTGTATLNLNTVGTKKLYIDPTTQVGSGDIPANFIGMVMYDSSLDSGSGGFLILNKPVIDGGSL
jgi:hypothetical protein